MRWLLRQSQRPNSAKRLLNVIPNSTAYKPLTTPPHNSMISVFTTQLTRIIWQWKLECSQSSFPFHVTWSLFDAWDSHNLRIFHEASQIGKIVATLYQASNILKRCSRLRAEPSVPGHVNGTPFFACSSEVSFISRTWYIEYINWIFWNSWLLYQVTMSSNAVRWKSITGDMNKAGVTPPLQPIHTRYDAPKTWKFTLRIGAHYRRQLYLQVVWCPQMPYALEEKARQSPLELRTQILGGISTVTVIMR